MKRAILTVLCGLHASTFAGCRAENAEETAVDECRTHELRPSRYRLLEIADEMKRLTQHVEEPSDHDIYIIPNHWSPFWVAPKAGFDAAKTELGFEGEFQSACDKGDLTCAEDQQALFRELTDGDTANGEADAIGLSSKDGTAIAPLVTEVSDTVPIITFDADVSSPMDTGRWLYLGAINKPSGREAAEAMFAQLSEDGTAHLYAQSFSAVNLMERAAGVFEACLNTAFANADEFAQSEYCANLQSRHVCEAQCAGERSGTRIVAHSYVDEFEADSEWQDANPNATSEDYLADSFANLLNGDSPPIAVISLHGTPGPVMYGVLSGHELSSEIRFVAWDLSEEVQQGLDDGSVHVALVQNAYFYGYVTAHIAYAMAAIGPEPVMNVLEGYFSADSEDKLLDTGITVITRQNLPFFLDYQVECLGLSTG